MEKKRKSGGQEPGGKAGGAAAGGIGERGRKEYDDKPSKILKYLYLGSKSHAKERSLLSSLGITHIVNCTPPRR